jgi:hypothetical protein
MNTTTTTETTIDDNASMYVEENVKALLKGRWYYNAEQSLRDARYLARGIVAPLIKLQADRACDFACRCPKCGGEALFLGESPDGFCSDCQSHVVTIYNLPYGEDPDVAVALRHDPKGLVHAARRVRANYLGTRLYGALRRAGLEEILQPINADLLSEI